MTSKAQFHYKIGDRVAERPKNHGLVAVSARAKQIAAENRSQRYGTIVGLTTKVKRTKNIINRKITPSIVKKAMELKNQGYSFKQICEQLDCGDRQTISKWIERLETYGEHQAFAKMRLVNEPYVLVQWDHLKSPTEHAQMRICPVSELERLTKEVIVPGE